MNYKASITYKINSIKSMNQLNDSFIKLEKLIDINRFKIFINRTWKKKYKTNADFSELFDSLLKKVNSKFEKPNEEELETVINNIFNKFNYEFNDNLVYYGFKNDLEKLVLNDEILIIDGVKYSKSLYQMFKIIDSHQKLKDFFLNVKNDTTLPLKEKGVAFSSNRNAKEVFQSIKNDIEDVLKLVEKNSDLEKMLQAIKNFEKNTYESIVILANINENTFNYLKDEKDIEVLKTILKIKKRFNASQGLKENDFIHSMKYWTISLFTFNETNKFGFNNQTDFIDFLNELLENVLDIESFKFEKRDLNISIQLKDYFFDNPIMEKVTPTNKKKHPILDNPKFTEEVKKLIQLSLKKSQYKIKK